MDPMSSSEEERTWWEKAVAEMAEAQNRMRRHLAEAAAYERTCGEHVRRLQQELIRTREELVSVRASATADKLEHERAMIGLRMGIPASVVKLPEETEQPETKAEPC